MKTKIIILLTILSGLIYCSNAFGTGSTVTLSNNNKVLIISNDSNSIINGEVYTISHANFNISTKPYWNEYTSINLKGYWTANDFLRLDTAIYEHLKAYNTDTINTYTNSSITETNAVINAYYVKITGYSSYYGPYRLYNSTLKGYNNVKFGYGANCLPVYAFYSFPYVHKIILPKSCICISNCMKKVFNGSKDTIIITNDSCFTYSTYPIDGCGSYYYTCGAFLKEQKVKCCTFKMGLNDSTVIMVPNKILKTYLSKRASDGIDFAWYNFKIIGYDLDSLVNTFPAKLTTNIQQVTSDETKPKIYPTLVTNTLNISGINQGNIIIYDLNGNAILRKEVQPQIDVSDLPKGIYLVSINNLCIGKIVK